MNEARLERNKKIREDYRQGRVAGERASDIFDDLAQRHTLSFDTVKNIVWDRKYETRYAGRKKSRLSEIKVAPKIANC